MSDISSQLEARKQNLSQKRNQPSSAETEHQVSQSVETILRNIEQRKTHLRDLQNNITKLQREYEEEAILLARDQEILRQFRETQSRNELENKITENDNKNVVSNNSNKSNISDSKNPSTGNSTNTTNTANTKNTTNTTTTTTNNNNTLTEEGRKKQEKYDEELALHLQRQFEMEDNENNANADNNANVNVNTSNQQPQNASTGHRVVSYTFGNDPSNMVTVTNSSHSHDSNNEHFDPYSMLTQFNTGHDEDFDNLNSPFFNSIFDMSNRQSQFPRHLANNRNDRRNNRRNDPLEQIFGMPLLRMGGMGMPFIDLDGLDHDTLLQLFPDVPRGASEENIQALPENTYVAKPKEKTNENIKENIKKTQENEKKTQENEKKIPENKEKNNDEVCCICLEEFKTGDPIRRLPCLHIFHKDEIDTWLRRNHICPICRIPIDESSQRQQQ